MSRIELNTPFAFSRIGQRTINQDALFPAEQSADDQTTLFLVCDGMGGADKGEVASQLLGQGIVNYATSMGFPVFDSVHLEAALSLVHDAFLDYMKQNPFVNRMGSTLALLQFHQRGVTVAHLGDSRIYLLREGKIIFQTKDHKQVNDMVEAGIITATQAQTHPWRNRLSRAVVMSAPSGDQPSPFTEPELTVLTDVRAGDYFFMCTDGVLEQLDDYTLEAILSMHVPDEAKGASLVARCEGSTKDNFSGYLIGVKYVHQTVSIANPTLS